MTGQAQPAPSRWRVLPWGVAAALLLLPLVAMQVTEEVAWDATDFLAFGVLLTLACGAFELTLRATRRTRLRVLAGLAIVAAFLLAWAELAVGVFTTLGS